MLKLLRKWARFHCVAADNREKPLAGRQLTFAVHTVKAALNGKAGQKTTPGS